MIQPNQHSQTQAKKQKTKEDYSRNVKKLKFKLQKIQQQILTYEKKIHKLSHTSNDQIIAMKISKFCKQRKFTPEMLFRFADTKCKNLVTRMEFRNTLIAVGLKLSQQELTRLQYLLDEDIKGDISLLEYSKYLHAFGLKTEHDPSDPFVKQTLKDIDFNKLLQIAKDDKNKKKKKDGDRILLTYEEFLKYCHKNFPEVKDKELAKIFKKLQHDQLVDLEDLIEYLQNLKRQKQRIANKNSPTKKKPEEDDKKKKGLTEDEQQTIDIDSLKGKLMAVFKQHPEKQQTFHSSEFRRVETNYKIQKGSMLSLFRQMDTKLVGSVCFNDIIGFYVEQETYKPNNHFLIKYSFILMGKKLLSVGQKPQSLIASFAKDQTYITAEQFSKLCSVEFCLKEQMAAKLYEVMLSCPGQKIKDNCVNTALLISLMKVSRKGIKNNVRPILEDQYKKYFYKKHHQTICTNGIVAYKICQSIVNQLATAEKYEKWDDFEFGPSPEDELGLDSIGSYVSNPNIRWHRATALNLTDFYLPANKDQQLYLMSPMCTHDIFYKSLEALVKYDEKILYRSSGEIVKHSKNVEESELFKLFEGIHPLAFHRFRERGIYVMQFFIKGKWLYVIVDNKIPCNEDDQPLFVRPGSTSCSFMLLVEKAYAKLKGSYQNLFDFPSLSKYINELSSRLVSFTMINDEKETKDEDFSKLLADTCNLQTRKKQIERRKNQRQTFTQVYLGNLTLVDKKVRNIQKSGLSTNTLSRIYFTTLIKDQRNPSTPHNLTLITCHYLIAPQTNWNPKWAQNSTNFRRCEPLIKAEVNKWDAQNETYKIYKNGRLESIILDSETVKETFNTIVEITAFKFDDSAVLLRKDVEFEKNFSCLYKINSTDKTQNVRLTVTLNKIIAPNDTKLLITLKPVSPSSAPVASQTLKGEFNCLTFSIPQFEHDLQIKVDKFDPDQQYVYQLSFYFDHPRYSLKERDRHLLFRYVSEYEERSKLEFDMLTEAEKRYFYEAFFLNANRKGFLCC